jgi:hypothetical protein
MSPAPRRRQPAKRSRSNTNRQPRPATGGRFWGTSTTFDDADDIPMPDDPTVVVRSLGTVPLQNREAHAERYFAAVYDKAAALATALAATVDLLDDGTDDDAP